MPINWLITGCSSGFGRLLSEAAHQRGDRVAATARKVETLAGIGTDDESRIARLPLDVRDRKTIDAAVGETIDRLGQIDVLVNNAGYGYFGTQEEGDLDEVREMYETNVFGLISTTQAVLPHMRERKAGTIVNLSSIAGRIGTPRGGFYQSTKWAIEALSESLYHEVSSFGLRVISIQPGWYDTDFRPRSARVSPADADEHSPYAGIRARWGTNASAEIFKEAQDPGEVVEGILQSVDGSETFLRLPMGADARMLIGKREAMMDADFVEWMRRLYHRAE